MINQNKKERLDALKDSCLHDWKLRLLVKDSKRLAEEKIKNIEKELRMLNPEEKIKIMQWKGQIAEQEEILRNIVEKEKA